MSSVSDPQEGSPRAIPETRSSAASPSLYCHDQDGVAGHPDAPQFAPRAHEQQDLQADSSSSHKPRSTLHTSASDISRDVTGAHRTVLASLIRECGETVMRSLLVEPGETQSGGKAPADDILDICAKAGSPVHALSRREPGMILVTFVDARDCAKVKATLARSIGTAVSVRDVIPEEPEHIVTGADSVHHVGRFAVCTLHFVIKSGGVRYSEDMLISDRKTHLQARPCAYLLQSAFLSGRVQLTIMSTPRYVNRMSGTAVYSCTYLMCPEAQIALSCRRWLFVVLFLFAAR